VKGDRRKRSAQAGQVAVGQHHTGLFLQDRLGARFQGLDLLPQIGQRCPFADAGRLGICHGWIGVQPFEIALQPPGPVDQVEVAPDQFGPFGFGEIADLPNAVLAQLRSQRPQGPSDEIELDQSGEPVQLVGEVPVGTGAATQQGQRQGGPEGEGEGAAGGGHGRMIPAANRSHS